MDTKRACLGPVLAVVVLLVSGCTRCVSEKQLQARTLIQAREMVLDLFGKMEGFELTKQLEVDVAGARAVRMEGSWKQDERNRRCIIMLVDNPGVFNVIHYTAPSANNLFEAGVDVFEQVVQQLKSVPFTNQLEVIQESDHQRMRSSDLQLEIRYPSGWIYTLDEDNQAVVLSGPKDQPTWLTTITFSVIHKWKS